MKYVNFFCLKLSEHVKRIHYTGWTSEDMMGDIRDRSVNHD